MKIQAVQLKYPVKLFLQDYYTLHFAQSIISESGRRKSVYDIYKKNGVICIEFWNVDVNGEERYDLMEISQDSVIAIVYQDIVPKNVMEGENV